MSRKSKIDRVEDNIVTMRDGSRWKVTSFDATTVKWWSTSDEIEIESYALNNVTRNQRVSAQSL